MNEKNNKYLVSIVGGRVDNPYHSSFVIEAKSLLEAFNKASEEIKKESNTFIVEIAKMNSKKNFNETTPSLSFILTLSYTDHEGEDRYNEILIKAESMSDALDKAISMLVDDVQIVGISEYDG